MSTGGSNATKRVTLRDIARLAQVSVATVSRVLNNQPYVDDVTREAVRRAAEELEYPLKNLRRPLQTTQKVVLLNREQSLPASRDINILGGIDRLMALGAQSFLEEQCTATSVRRSHMRPDEAWEYANDPDVSGLILLGGVHDHGFVRALQTAGLPFVVAGAHLRPLEVNCVMANYIQGMEQAVAHLVERGRRRIGLVNGPPTTNTSEEKYKGLRLALSLHGLPFAPEQVVAGDFLSEAGHAKTLELLARTPDLDAIIYCDDVAAVGGLSALKERGRRVPDDVAVIGFHDYDIARFTDPPLTSVHFDMRLMGVMAARRLCMMMDDSDDQNWFMLVPTSLMVRGST